MKRILIALFLLTSIITIDAQSNNLRGTIIGTRNPSSPLVRPDTLGVPRFKYYDFSAQQLYNWNDSTETWAATNNVLLLDVGSFKQNQQYLHGYKTYKAIISQAGGSAPTVNVLENTIGSIVASRILDGVYYFTLSGAFTTNKTFIYGQPEKTGTVVVYRDGTDRFIIESGGVDSILDQYCVEVNVYY